MLKVFGVILLSCLLWLNNLEVVMSKDTLINLPEPNKKGKISLEEAILKRRSQRSFLARDLTLDEISQLLWAAQGITGKGGSFNFRAAPSAGALYPLEIYILTKDGLYHYLPTLHKLKVLAERDLRSALANSALGQSAVSEAAVDIVICAVYGRTSAKYGRRGIQYVHMEAGHIAQNIHLQAVALGLGSVPIGAFDDKLVAKVLSLPWEEEPLYIIPVGYPD